MLKTGILNPHILSLLASVRHTNTIVISDRGFPFWPTIETVDISLCDDIPCVLDVVRALRPNFVAGKAWMAQEFLKVNAPKIRAHFSEALEGIKTARAARDRAYPHRRHDSVCEHDFAVGLVFFNVIQTGVIEFNCNKLIGNYFSVAQTSIRTAAA